MTPPRRAEAGYTLVALMASVTIMLILMAAAVPSWRYVMKNDAEEELIFRGGQIADAIARYQQRNGNALPPSLEVLVKGRYLRKEYKDPMTKDGKWRLIRQGESIGPVRPPSGAGAAGTSGAAGVRSPTAARGSQGLPGAPSSSPAGGTTGSSGRGAASATGRSSRFGQPGGTLGGIQGVVSTSEETGLRVFNGRTKYNEWVFLPGQPRDVGRAQRRQGVPGAVPGQPAGLPARPTGTPSGIRR
ncbi:MAG: type II secretion system GspH family protein [Acidobacteria bacterium]|nr:type II secretion system GspH family protein [Acidobacteriota bacterium]